MNIHLNPSPSLSDISIGDTKGGSSRKAPECVTAAAPLFVGTETIYPFRDFLRDGESNEDVRVVVADYLNRQIKSYTETPTVELVDTIQNELCGPEPLTRSQILCFLDAVADAMLDILTARVELWKERTRATSTEGETAAVMNAAAKTTASMINTGAKRDAAVHKLRKTFADMDLLATQESPETVDRKLSLLTSLEAKAPEVARWFRLVEFGGATTDDLADYFSISEGVIVRELDCALAIVTNVMSLASC